MKATINITYQHYIPEEWVNEIEPLFNNEEIQIEKYKNENKYFNCIGSGLSDITIFIIEHPESIFLYPALYDILKITLIVLWKKLKKLNIVRQDSSGKTESKIKTIAVNYEDSQNRKVKITIDSNLNENLISEIIESALNIIKSNKKDEFFNKKEFVSNSENSKKIELFYNKTSKTWEPFNFENYKRKMDEYLREINENSND
ncbi:MAG: hypothetical protein PF481_07585 [Bacteroidales bacterium]|jgi:hypothetical protein|nr:hypothetical protein [Bacteroidales bacterium]